MLQCVLGLLDITAQVALNQFYTHVPVEKHINLMLFYG